MKRLNLLPAEVRPREGGRRSSSYVVVGALAAAVLAMLSYGIVMGGVRSDESELVALKDEAADAQARADALSPYGAFAEMKETRERSVRTVAETRFDYERLTRELARVLPSGVWIGHLEVAPAPPTDEVQAAGADPVEAAPVTPPAMTISGCAPDQDVVADTLDQLRALTGATDVALGSSSRSAASGSSSGGNKPYLVSGSGGGGCDAAGRPKLSFDATVTLTAPQVEPTSSSPTPATTTTAAETGS